MKKLIKKNFLLSPINSSLINLPCPSTINSLWSIGSMLGMMLTCQILTGIFLTMHYSPHPDLAFLALVNINYNVNWGWIMKSCHANGASIFFMLMFSHTLRNIYFSSFFLMLTWASGVTILLISILTAFLGYVLPWGQMSFWGATVITNLLSAIPYLGVTLVEWLWGGFSVDTPTLNRFYTFHFLFPFIVMLLVLIHLIFLHSTGSSNPLGVSSMMDKIPFHPFFTSKDCIGFIVLFMVLISMSSLFPDILMDPENFSKANPLTTPPHIQPEWYFLFAYSILRSIPNKLGGVIALTMSILVLYLFPLLTNYYWQSNKFNPLLKMIFWTTLTILILLTWLGMKPVNPPFEMINILLTPTYFFFMIATPMMNK
uniref:Cytochrome b n=1 Tax=Pauropus longiramus TaxID=933850 RepID=G9BG50_9MYRI|nr:cytochrome b [Pauropus longiramus]ADT63088.1 cytochrome b [Pauropus longiramus]